MKAMCISCFDCYANRMEQIIEFLEQKGYGTKYIITDFNHFSKTSYKTMYRNSKHLHVIPYKDNISPQRLLSHHFFSKAVLKEIRVYRPDLIYCMLPPNSLAKDLGKYKKNHDECKLVFDIYDMWPESIPLKRFKFFSKIPFKIWADMRDKGIKKADLITTVSRESGKTVRRLIRGTSIPIKVIYPVIKDIKRPEYKFRKQGCLSFCYLGNINYITDMDLMLNLLKEIRKYTGVRVHFIGDGLNYGKLTKILESMGIEVAGHGAVFEMAEKNKIFSMCDMGINLPKKEIHSSMSLKSVEYLRAGLPFINSGLGDNWEMVEKRNIGINITKDSVKETAGKIAELTTDRLEHMHKCCISIYEKYYMGQDLEKIFQSIL